MISSVTSYNVPWEKDSQDRILNVNLLSNYLLVNVTPAREVVKVTSYQLENKTTLSLIAKGTVLGNNPNYFAVVFEQDTQVYYYFVTDITGTPSLKQNTYEYELELDAVATYGNVLFAAMEDQPIFINRLHEERYIIRNNQIILNTDYAGLINSDFEVTNITTGSKLFYVATGLENETNLITQNSQYQLNYHAVAAPENFSGNGPYIKWEQNVTHIIDNTVKQNDSKIYYLYALIRLNGAPRLFSNSQMLNLNNNVIVMDADIYNSNNNLMSQTVLAPVSTNNTPGGFSLNATNVDNSIENFSKLQTDKVVNIFKSPFPLSLELYQPSYIADYRQLLYDDAGNRFTRANINETDNLISIIDSDIPSYTIASLYTNTINSKGTNVNVANAFKKTKIIRGIIYEPYNLPIRSQTYNDLLGVSNLNNPNVINPSITWADDSLFLGVNKVTLTNAEINDLKNNTSNLSAAELEPALLHPTISRCELHFSQQDMVVLDTANFFKSHLGVADSKISFDFVINEEGMDIKAKISDNQYFSYNYNSLVSFESSQGATYLARNKYTQQAQRAGIELQRNYTYESLRSQQAQSGASAANPIQAIFSLGASIAGGTAAAAIAGNQMQINQKIAENEKAKIKTGIQDAYGTAPTVNGGAKANAGDLLSLEMKGKFNFRLQRPNPIITRKIANFHHRFGTTLKDWKQFKIDAHLKNRTRFNFLEIDNALDFIKKAADVPQDALLLFASELAKGIRVWHVDTINYDADNLEVALANNTT